MTLTGRDSPLTPALSPRAGERENLSPTRSICRSSDGLLCR